MAAATAVLHEAPAAATSLQYALGAVALMNLLLSVSTWHASRQKAASARLDALEATIRTEIAAHASLLVELKAKAEEALTHDHLAEVYRELRTMATKVDTMVGVQEQATALLRQLLQQQLR